MCHFLINLPLAGNNIARVGLASYTVTVQFWVFANAAVPTVVMPSNSRRQMNRHGFSFVMQNRFFAF